MLGEADYFDGRALLMFVELDDLCKNLGERIGRNAYSLAASSELCVHGLRVIELLPLSDTKTRLKHGSLSEIVLRKCQPVQSLRASYTNLFTANSPSRTDSIVPLLTLNQQRMLSAGARIFDDDQSQRNIFCLQR